MDYPKTDGDWEKLAECIVTKHTGVSPEIVGGLTVGATATIFTWYKGEERSKALNERQYARDRLMELAKEAGCLEEREEIVMSGRMIEVPLERPFPKTYGDWVSLAEDIKEKYPDDPVMRASVNYQLNLIAREEDVTPVVEEAEVEEAKRWLTKKAGELGIK